MHTTKKRNEHMANLFYVLHLMEREGSGYDMMYETLLANGKSTPKVTEGDDWVKVRVERKDPRLFTVFFSGGDANLPVVKGLNFNSDDAFIVEHSLLNDTVSYWLRDTALVNQDTLTLQLSYMATDTLGNLSLTTDTLDVLSKVSYEKRQKDRERKYEEWKKQQDKAKKRGKEYQEQMPIELLEPKYNVATYLDPDRNITVEMPTPLARIDTSMIHLYARHDTLWYRSKFIFRERKNVARSYELIGEWRPGVEYSVHIRQW